MTIIGGDVKNHGVGVTDKLEMRFQELDHHPLGERVDLLRDILSSIKLECSDPELSIKYMHARMCEERYARRDDDLNLAEMDFTYLIDSGKKYFVGEGLVGRARVIYRKDSELHVEEALSLCNRAVEMEGNALAMMLMAAIYMDKKNDAETARKCPMRAFKSGSIWGVRYMSVISYRRKNYILSMGWRILSIICTPFAQKRYRLRGPFK